MVALMEPETTKLSERTNERCLLEILIFLQKNKCTKLASLKQHNKTMTHKTRRTRVSINEAMIPNISHTRGPGLAWPAIADQTWNGLAELNSQNFSRAHKMKEKNNQQQQQHQQHQR